MEMKDKVVQIRKCSPPEIEVCQWAPNHRIKGQRICSIMIPSLCPKLACLLDDKQEIGCLPVCEINSLSFGDEEHTKVTFPCSKCSDKVVKDVKMATDALKRRIKANE